MEDLKLFVHLVKYQVERLPCANGAAKCWLIALKVSISSLSLSPDTSAGSQDFLETAGQLIQHRLLHL
jgi:hypothetical protein